MSAGRSAPELDQLGSRLDELGETEALAILSGLERRLDRFDREREAGRRRTAWLRDRLLEQVALNCRRAGHRRIALYGAGLHTVGIVRHPWRHHGIEVVALLDDAPRTDAIEGAPVIKPEALTAEVDAIVLSSDSHEPVLYRRAVERFGARGLPILRIYGAEAITADPADRAARLVAEHGCGAAEAEWLVSAAAEGVDPNLPVGCGRAAESALRRYEFAAQFARGRRTLDVGCRGGFGTSILRMRGAARHAFGIDRDPRAIDYARRRYGAHGVEFDVADPRHPPGDDGSVDLLVAFDAVDLAREAAEVERLLAVDGLAIIGQSLDDAGSGDVSQRSLRVPDAVGGLVEIEQWGQVHADEPRSAGRPAGFFRLDVNSAWPDVWIVVLKRDPGAA